MLPSSVSFGAGTPAGLAGPWLALPPAGRIPSGPPRSLSSTRAQHRSSTREKRYRPPVPGISLQPTAALLSTQPALNLARTLHECIPALNHFI
ncbi:hypothetical protein K491DRAFT_687427, partial [Lophiostoma macrostomum CBS 122681]